jgi:superoxide dismutase, Cu-Zn family
MSDVIDAPVVGVVSLPGEAVFPESIGLDPAGGDAYVGSLADGTLFRARVGRAEAEVWSAAGADGRSSVAGVKVDAGGRLWAAGGYDGTLWVYSLESGELLARLDVGMRPSCVNDIAFAADGTAFVTDSFVPTLFRVDGSSFALEPWIDLGASGVPWPEGLNLNGIVVTADGRHLVACQTNTGRLWRVSLESGAVSEVRVEGGPLEHCDGMAVDGSRLYVAVNALGLIAVGALSADGSSFQAESLLRSTGFAFPTSVAVRGDELLVVNAQLDKMGGGGEPELPFTVAVVRAPS